MLARLPRPGRTLVPAALLLSVVAASSAARAAGPNDAAAEALFGEAKKLATQGKYAEACPKFAESNKLDRGAGTLIHLGDCYEKNKQTASAWATYKEAASAAQALNRKDWEKLASQRATALEAKLARLTIKVDRANVEGPSKTEVSRDGTSVSQPSWGVPIPVDIGPHTVEATSPGHIAFKSTVTVAKDGESVEVVIPKLEAEAAASPIAKPTPATSSPTTRDAARVSTEKDGSNQRTLGFVVGGVGLIGLAVGAVTGLMAISQANEAKAACPEDGRCASKDAVDASESARSLGLISTIGFIAGALGVTAGSVLVFTAPSGPSTNKGAASSPPLARSHVRVSPTAGLAGGGLSFTGSF
jgi:tetratricopeptide (TPR) repeat protein